MNCLAVYTKGRKKGKPCEQQATTDGYCGAHAPEYKAERMRRQGLRNVPVTMLRPSGHVPGIMIAPFCICNGLDTSGCPFHGKLK